MSAILTVAALAVAGVGSAAAQEPGCQSIVDAIGANGLNRLGEAVLGVAGEDEAADLAALATATTPLPESEKVTIFAPNDAAWPAPEDLPTDASDIIDILLGHVVPAYLRSEDVLGALAADGKATLMSLAGTDVIASLEGEDVYVAAEGMEMPGAKAVAFDVETCAGVIHVIDKVLIASPEDDMMDDGMPMDDGMMDDGNMMGNDTMMGNCTTLVDAITKEGLSRLGEAVLSLEENANATGLLALATQSMELPEDQKITLFAPNNSAWPPVAALPTGDDLLAVLNGHIVPAYLPSAAAINATANETVTLDTLEMTKLNATQEAGELYIAAKGMMGPGAKVIAVDVETCIGVVHVVDKVLIADDALNATTSEPAEMDEEETEGEEQATEETIRSTIPSGTEVTPNGAASDLVFGAVASVAAAAALLI